MFLYIQYLYINKLIPYLLYNNHRHIWIECFIMKTAKNKVLIQYICVLSLFACIF